MHKDPVSGIVEEIVIIKFIYSTSLKKIQEISVHQVDRGLEIDSPVPVIDDRYCLVCGNMMETAGEIPDGDRGVIIESQSLVKRGLCFT